MSLGVPNLMLLLSSYSNPVATLKHAQQEGYKALDFMVTAMPFGMYSSESKVTLGDLSISILHTMEIAIIIVGLLWPVTGSTTVHGTFCSSLQSSAQV